MGIVRMFFEELSISYTALFMFFGAAILLLFSDKLQKDPVIQPWIVDYHPYIWILLSVSGLYLVVSIIVNLIKGVGRMWRRARKEKILNEVMKNLTQEDMEILTLFYNCVDNTVQEAIELNFLDSKVQRLEDKGVILSLAFSGVIRSDCSICPMIFMINPKAKEFLLKTAPDSKK